MERNVLVRFCLRSKLCFSAPDFHEDTDLSWRNRRRREIPNPARSLPGKGVATPSFAAKAGFVAGVEGATETALLSALDCLV